MQMRLTWNETKRRSNLRKHGLDFADAGEVLYSRYRLDVSQIRDTELRVQSFAYGMKRLAVLTAVHTERDGSARIISFRFASQVESESFYEWISQETE